MRVIGMCDGLDCKNSGLVDPNTGRPDDWWVVRVQGTTITGDKDHPMVKRVDETVTLCPACFSKLRVPYHVRSL